MSTVVPDTRTLRSTDRILALPETARQRPRAAFAVLLGLAAVVFLAGLGRSSLFVDEIYSWNASRDGFGGVFEAVRGTEVTPPLYYVLLHGWLTLTGADSEAVMRLPSALAGIGLVAATAWLGTVVLDRRAGLIAGVLTALSPLTLQYAQEVRAYIFVMLAVTVAAAAAVKLAAEPRRRRWLALTVGASAVAVLLHYTAVLVLFPLSVWILTQRQLPLRARLAVGASAAIPFLALTPLLAIQLAAGHHSVGGDAYAKITPMGLLRLASTPFDGRAISSVAASYELGFLALVDSVALVALADRFRHLRARWLLVAASVLPVVLIVGVSALAHPMALTRYTAVASPFMLVTVAVAALRMPRALGIGLVGLSLAAGGIGIAMAQMPDGQWPNLRSAMQATGAQWRPGDAVVSLRDLSFGGVMDYYDQRELPAGASPAIGYPSAYNALEAGPSRRALARGHSVWVISASPVAYEELRGAARRAGAEVLSEQQFGGSYNVQVNRVERGP